MCWNQSTQTLQCANRIQRITSRNKSQLAFDWDRLIHSPQSGREHTFSTVVDGIDRMKGGRIATLDAEQNSLEWKTYERSVAIKQAELASYTTQDFIDAYRATIEQAVFRRIQDHSNPLVTLSGGFDSSIIYALASQHTPVRAATICTSTSIHNNELDRARELSLQAKGAHLLFPVAFHDKPSANEWIQLILSKESIHCGFEDFVKSQLMQRCQQEFGQSQLVLSGMGSDQFNGGTTPLDYATTGENGSLDVFMNGMMRKKWNDYRSAKYSAWFQFAYHFSTVDYRESLWPFEGDPWSNYMRNNGKSLQKRGVFLESKLTAANGFGVAFPFLDQASIDLLEAIPEQLRGALLYDKQILRAAFKDLLPDSFWGQPKFYRTHQAEAKIYGYLKNVIYGNNCTLVKRAWDASPGLQKRFSIDKLLSFLKQTESTADFPAYPHLLSLINCGLLEAQLFYGEDFDRQQPLENTMLYDSNNSAFDREAIGLRVLGKPARDPVNLPLTKSPDVAVFKSSSNEVQTFVLTYADERFLSITNGDVLLVLEAIDGQKSLSEICIQLELSLKSVSEALAPLFEKELIYML